MRFKISLLWFIAAMYMAISTLYKIKNDSYGSLEELIGSTIIKSIFIFGFIILWRIEAFNEDVCNEIRKLKTDGGE